MTSPVAPPGRGEPGERRLACPTTGARPSGRAAKWHRKVPVDSSGEKIGKLQDVYVDTEAGEAQFGPVKEGFTSPVRGARVDRGLWSTKNRRGSRRSLTSRCRKGRYQGPEYRPSQTWLKHVGAM